MEIKRDQMIHLGYAKYWRSDEILGLLPIEEDRGPGRRTEVYVASLEVPIVASRSEAAILRDMAAMPEEMARGAELRAIIEDLREALEDLSPVLRRMLKNEGQLDVEYWIRRIRQATEADGDPGEQEELFSGG
ncbi:MAG: hypothetical protein ACE5HQ_02085 [Gemmatimonadota bacterium]